MNAFFAWPQYVARLGVHSPLPRAVLTRSKIRVRKRLRPNPERKLQLRHRQHRLSLTWMVLAGSSRAHGDGQVWPGVTNAPLSGMSMHEYCSLPLLCVTIIPDRRKRKGGRASILLVANRWDHCTVESLVKVCLSGDNDGWLNTGERRQWPQCLTTKCSSVCSVFPTAKLCDNAKSKFS